MSIKDRKEKQMLIGREYLNKFIRWPFSPSRRIFSPENDKIKIQQRADFSSMENHESRNTVFPPVSNPSMGHYRASSSSNNILPRLYPGSPINQSLDRAVSKHHHLSLFQFQQRSTNKFDQKEILTKTC